MHLFKNCQIQFLILYELIVWACFIWVIKLHRTVADDEIGLCALIRRLVVTAQETWFTLHNISRLLFLAAGRQLLCTHAFFQGFVVKSVAWLQEKPKQTHCLKFAPVLCITVTDCGLSCLILLYKVVSPPCEGWKQWNVEVKCFGVFEQVYTKDSQTDELKHASMWKKNKVWKIEYNLQVLTNEDTVGSSLMNLGAGQAQVLALGAGSASRCGNLFWIKTLILKMKTFEN